MSLIQDSIVADKYRVLRKFGSGSYSDVYLGIDITNDQLVALKVESTSAHTPQLQFEHKLYKILNKEVGIPKIRCFTQDPSCRILVMDLLGPSLEDLFSFCGSRFTVKTWSKLFFCWRFR